MRRGHEFEHQIDKLIKYVNSKGWHAHKNYPERLNDGTYINGEPYDYEIMAPGYTACFDAKECHADNWPFTEKEIKQAENLKHCKNAGADAFFLVYFTKLKSMVKFDVDVFIQALGEGRKHLKIKEGGKWEWEKVLK